jgi:DNA polymerase elongation subunit (family B)
MFAQAVSVKAPLLFMPTDMFEKTDYAYGRPTLSIYMFGILPCGSKTYVKLTNISVYVDVMVPGKTTAGAFTDYLRENFMSKGICYSELKTVNLNKFRGFQKAPRSYIRVCTNTLADRKLVIDHIAFINATRTRDGMKTLQTANDDMGFQNNYLLKVARDYRFNTADWNRFTKYTVLPSSTTTNCTYAFAVNVGDFKKLTKADRLKYAASNHPLRGIISKDPTVVAQWDIENDRKILNGMVAKPSDDDYCIYMICSCYFFQYSDEPFLSICAVDCDAKARQGVDIIIICKTERNVLLAHMDALGAMSPDILSAFNGGNYDWPLYRGQLSRMGLLVRLKEKLSSLPLVQGGRYADTSENISKWSFRAETVKIDAETRHVLDIVAQFPGMLDTDVLPVFLQLYPRNEVRKTASLNFFLASNGLPSKEDLPYKTQFKIHARALDMQEVTSCHCAQMCPTCTNHICELDNIPVESATLDGVTYSSETYPGVGTTCCYCAKKGRSADHMAHIAYYCVIDCVRPQQLYVKRMIIPDKRELATMSCTRLYEAFYRAHGMKVLNLVGRHCNKANIAFSNARVKYSLSDKVHYPGAHVFAPVRGFHNGDMITITTSDGTKTDLISRPIFADDFSSLYPSLMMAYNYCISMLVTSENKAARLIAEGYTLHRIEPFEVEYGEKKGAAGNRKATVSGWTVRHNGITKKGDTHVITHYNKIITLSWEENGAHELTYIEKHGISVEQFDQDNGSTSVSAGHDTVLTGGSDQPFTQEEALRRLSEAGIAVSRKIIYEPIYGRVGLPGEHMGAFPTIVKKLFDKRVPVKREFVSYEKLLERMKIDDITEAPFTHGDGTTEVITAAEANFRKNKVNSKQLAIKLLSNMFYGKAGDYTGPIFNVLIAGGITSSGQYNIKMVDREIAIKNYVRIYGDTDSIYMYAPAGMFAKCDEVYFALMKAIHAKYAGTPVIKQLLDDSSDIPQAALDYKAERVAARLAWWSEQVRISQRAAATITEHIIDILLDNNGTLFLAVAYEEVGLPTSMNGKKKYFMTPHIDDVNFSAKPMIRGIDVIKQGHSQVSKEIGMSVIRELLSPENERTAMEIVKDKIRWFYSHEHNPRDFAQAARYRTDKKNVPVHTFVDRMVKTQALIKATDPSNHILHARYQPPDAGDKFLYVIVERPQAWTIRGTMEKMGKGDKMEYLHVLLESQSDPNPLKIDLNHYMKKTIVGILARFIVYEPEFQPESGRFDQRDKDQYKALDKYCIDKATEYLVGFCDSITNYDPKANARLGVKYRAVYKAANKAITKDLGARFGMAAHCITTFSFNTKLQDAPSTQIVGQIKAAADAYAKDSISVHNGTLRLKYILRVVQGINVIKIKKACDSQGTFSPCHNAVKICDDKERVIVERLFVLMRVFGPMITDYDTSLATLMDSLRQVGERDPTEAEISHINEFTESEVSTLNEIRSLQIRLAAVYAVRQSNRYLLSAINVARAKITDSYQIINTPSMIRDMADKESKAAATVSYEFR